MITVSQVTSRLADMVKDPNLSDEDREILEEACRIISHNFHYYEPTYNAIMGYGLKSGPLVRSQVRSSPERPYLPNPSVFK